MLSYLKFHFKNDYDLNMIGQGHKIGDCSWIMIDCQRMPIIVFTKYYLKTFDHFSKSFLNCFKLDIFKEKLVNFNIWLNNNITYVFKSFAENFSNFNLALKNLFMYKSEKKT